MTRDIISNLPDSLIYHIHSFLDIKVVARSSVLSKRWYFIWITVPALHFRTLSFGSHTSGTNEFMDFVDGTLHRHLSNIDKFSLQWFMHLNETRVYSWISTAIRHNVKHLRLYLNQDRPMFVPLSLFTCESLTSLEVKTFPNVRLPKHISFPRLKRLELSKFFISGKSWNEEIFSNSPLLEELELHNCFYDLRNFCISIPMLKLLKIQTSREDENGLRECVLKIHAPKLVTFSYRGFATKEFVLSSFPELREAAVDFTFEDNGRAEVISRLLCGLKHVNRLSVDDKTLQAVCSPCNVGKNLLTFHNLKKLIISDVISSDQGLISLLQAAPNLESLVIEEYMNDELIEIEYSDEDNEIFSDEDDSEEAEEYEDDDADSVEGENNHVNEDEGNVAEYSEEAEGDEDDDDEHDNADSVVDENNHVNENEGDVAGVAECEENLVNGNGSWSLDNVATGCLFRHLKSVRFQQFVGNPREMRWVEVILKNAEALQMMTIHYCDNVSKYICRDHRFVDGKSEEEVEEEIPNIPRASSGCVFKFPSWEHRVKMWLFD